MGPWHRPHCGGPTSVSDSNADHNLHVAGLPGQLTASMTQNYPKTHPEIPILFRVTLFNIPKHNLGEKSLFQV